MSDTEPDILVHIPPHADSEWPKVLGLGSLVDRYLSDLGGTLIEGNRVEDLLSGREIRYSFERDRNCYYLRGKTWVNLVKTRVKKSSALHYPSYSVEIHIEGPDKSELIEELKSEIVKYANSLKTQKTPAFS
jgi:hypothetical protein